MAEVSVKATMAISFYLFLKAWGTAFIQGYKSGKAGERTEEDLEVSKKVKALTSSSTDTLKQID